MWRGMVGVMLMTIATTGGRIVDAKPGHPGFGLKTPRFAPWIDRGFERSATFRELTAGLDNANVIVYVRSSPCSAGAPAAGLGFGRHGRTTAG